jgi:uncharacterized protein (DUF1778 family)
MRRKGADAMRTGDGVRAAEREARAGDGRARRGGARRVRAGLACLPLAAGLLWAGGCGSGAAPSAAPGTAAGTAAPAAAAGGAVTRTAAGRPSGGRRFTPNPALRAASEIILVAQVVPFSHSQVERLLPVLRALAAHPAEPPAELASRARAITAVFTRLQLEAIRNLEKSRFGQGRPFRAPQAGSSPAGARARGRRFNPAAIYQRAILVLEGKASGGFGFPGGQPGTTGASGTA